MKSNTFSSLLFLLLTAAFAFYCWLQVPPTDGNIDGPADTYPQFRQYRQRRPGPPSLVCHYKPDEILLPSRWIEDAGRDGPVP